MSKIHTIEYILELRNAGFTWEWIAEDAQIDIASLFRRLERNGIDVKA